MWKTFILRMNDGVCQKIYSGFLILKTSQMAHTKRNKIQIESNQMSNGRDVADDNKKIIEFRMVYLIKQERLF